MTTTMSSSFTKDELESIIYCLKMMAPFYMDEVIEDQHRQSALKRAEQLFNRLESFAK